jgi:predicted dehydrogenase
VVTLSVRFFQRVPPYNGPARFYRLNIMQNKIRFGIVGSGWRSEIYLRIARKLPEIFEVTAVLVRNHEKAAALSKIFSVPVTLDKNEFLGLKPDFIVDAVSKDAKYGILLEYAAVNVPVLLETPAGLTVQELKNIWKLYTHGAKIQVAEQYQFYSCYRQMISLVREHIIGEPQSILLSSVHDYHAASLARLILGLKYEPFSVSGKVFMHSIVETQSRTGSITDGRMAEKEQKIVTIEFSGNRQLFYLFNPVQYHSDLRSNTVVIYGERGEIHDSCVRYITADNKTGIRTLTCDGQNELTDDEQAVAECLKGMMQYTETGTEFYPLPAALQDAYTGIVMDLAVKKGRTVRTRAQVWQK